MSRTLYYTIRTLTYDEGTPNGLLDIFVYDIIFNIPKLRFTIGMDTTDGTTIEENIMQYLENNDIEGVFNFKRL